MPESLIPPPTPPFAGSPPGSLRAWFDGLQVSERWDAAEITRAQQAQLTKLLAWTWRHSPYYRTKTWMADAAAAAERTPEVFWGMWRQLPTLSKFDLRAENPSFFADSLPNSHLPLGHTRTSGSTGIPVEVRTTAWTRMVWAALTMREHAWRRRDYSKKFGAIRYFEPAGRSPQGQEHSSWGWPAASLFPTGPAGSIHVAFDVGDLACWLRRFDPHYLQTYPSVAAALFDIWRGDKPRALEEVSLFSEPVPLELEERLHVRWSTRVAESYSANETGYIALRCEHNSLHVQAESVVVEILDAAGKPCAAGQSGRVVVTPLYNLATPLIRFDIGDYATVGDRCLCGRALPVIKRVLGRVRNLAQTPQGKRFWPVELGRVRAVEAVRQFQYVQTALQTIQLRLVLSRPLDEAERARAAQLAQNALGYPFNVEVVPVSQIERGPTGKFEEFLSLLPQ